MPLFRKLSDEEWIAKHEREERKILETNYDLLPGQSNYPQKSYLLKPDSIYATSYDKLGQDKVRIHIGYKKTWSGWVTETMRMNYNQIVLGTLLCENVTSIEQLPYHPKSEIEIPILSKTKKIIFPMQQTDTIAIKCRKIFIEDIDIYVMHEGGLILDSEFREMIQTGRMKV